MAKKQKIEREEIICYKDYMTKVDGREQYDFTIMTKVFEEQFLKEKLPRPVLTLKDIDTIKSNKIFIELQEYYEKKNIYLCMINFVYTCAAFWNYLKDIMYVLLKPTIADVAKEVDKIQEVGGSTNSMLLEVVKNSILLNADKVTYETKSLKYEPEIQDKSYLQSRFCYGMALFLNQFVVYKRGNSCKLILGPERRAILEAMSILGITAATNTADRYRQYCQDHPNIFTRGCDICGKKLKIDFVKYSDWSKGIYQSIFNEDDVIHFTGIENPPQWYLDSNGKNAKDVWKGASIKLTKDLTWTKI